ncbi:hypothetical protein JDFR1000234_13 [uncultured archaeal virus]|jgi:hypothetical protein|uniref:Uncharacterized protein n=1 Tax=uncultured archaeal virus TaxID=1960247 RepID=A0A1S5Y302_9VIRU|nr:hypothetical protein JDFR1000234_13 [uncultured archaeal virus]
MINLSKKRIKLTCDICPVGEDCPHYSSGSECALVEEEIRHLSEIQDEYGLMQYIIESRVERYLMAKAIEQVSREGINSRVSDLEAGLISMIATYLKVKYPERFRAKKYISRPKSGVKLEDVLQELEGE